MNPKHLSFTDDYIKAGLCRFAGRTTTGQTRLAIVAFQETTLKRHARDHFRALWPNDRFSKIELAQDSDSR